MFPIDYNGDVLNHNARVVLDGGIVESLDFLNDFSEQTKRINYNSLFDQNAQSFITAASITDFIQQSAVDTLVKDLKKYNLWSKMKAIYPFVGGTASSHKFNLKDPRDVDGAFRLVFTGGWTHTLNGVQGNGSNNVGNTNIVANTILSSTNGNQNAYDFGYTQFGLALYSSSSYFMWGSLTSASGSYSPGMFTVSRIGDTHKGYYNNNILLTSTSAGAVSALTINLGFGAGTYSSKTYSFATIGDGLTDTDAANLYSAVQKYQTTLGRQV